MRRLPQLDVANLGLVLAVALGLLRLPAQRAHPLVELGDDVRDPHEVLPGLVELLFGRLLLGLELGDAGGLFDQHAAILRLGRDDQADAALLDDRVRLRADAGAEEEVRDVTQPTRRLVDVVLAEPVAVEPARQHDLGVARELRRRPVGEQLRHFFLRRRDRVAFGIDPRAVRVSPSSGTSASSCCSASRSVEWSARARAWPPRTRRRRT